MFVAPFKEKKKGRPGKELTQPTSPYARWSGDRIIVAFIARKVTSDETPFR
jgi:hypothetical protein